MSIKSHRVLKIVGSVLCFIIAGLLLCLDQPTTPRAVGILTAVGAVLLGMFLLVSCTSAPVWILWCLAIGSLAGFYSGDIYEVVAGQRHWLRLLPLLAILLISIFAKTRDDRAA